CHGPDQNSARPASASTNGTRLSPIRRTIYSHGALTKDNYGRDHHPRCFSIWLAGAGIKGGITYGETDDYSYSVVKDPVDIRDLPATILQQLGIEHTRLTYKFQGRDYRLTDVSGNVVKGILA